MASSTATSPRVSYIIAELEDADSVFAPIKTANRVKVIFFSILLYLQYYYTFNEIYFMYLYYYLFHVILIKHILQNKWDFQN